MRKDAYMILENVYGRVALPWLEIVDIRDKACVVIIVHAVKVDRDQKGSTRKRSTALLFL